MPEMDVVRVYRPPETVFDKRTMSSFTSLDVTNEHPDELVDSKNWKRHAVGHTGEDVARDGEFIRVPIIIRDQSAIDDVKRGKRGLSFGYTCDVEPESGTTPQGEHYDAIQRSLTGNHLAICGLGRAGSECRIEDSPLEQEPAKMPGENTNIRTVMVDGIPVQATEASATVIDTLQSRVKRASEDNLKLVSDHATEIKVLQDRLSQADKDLAERDVELKTLKDKAADAGAIDKLVADRVDVLTKAKALGLKDEDVRSKTNEDVVRLAVSKKLGDSAVAGKSYDYVLCAFDLYSKNSDGQVKDHDPLAEAVRRSGGIGSATVTDEAAAEEAHAKMVADMQNAYKNPLARVN